MGNRKRRNKAQRRSKTTKARRFQRRLGQGKVEAPARERWFQHGDLLDEADRAYVQHRHEIVVTGDIVDGHPLSPYRAAG